MKNLRRQLDTFTDFWPWTKLRSGKPLHTFLKVNLYFKSSVFFNKLKFIEQDNFIAREIGRNALYFDSYNVNYQDNFYFRQECR
jgi:hypothetical protein